MNDVLDALKYIKLGKHDGKYSLTSDHVVNSSRRFLVILSILMSSMLVHGYNAADLLSSTIKECGLTTQECGLTTLETRRLRGDQIEVFKILNGYENIDSNIFV